MESDLLVQLRTHIKDEMEGIEKGLAAGNARGMEDYHRAVGAYAALVDVLNEIAKLEERYLEA